jgi:paraquat-inducible protein A
MTPPPASPVSPLAAAPLTARAAGLVACTRCTRVWPLGTPTCARCGSRLVSRDPLSLSRVWAWWVAGLIAYVPANLWPMLRTRALGHDQSSTILGGAMDLVRHGAIGVGLIIILASVVIPLSKFIAIAALARAVHQGALTSAATRHRIHAVVEYIGRWSMIDVFVVAILTALVQLSVVASIEPGPAALAFALSVIFTMFSAQAFDPRLIWDDPGPAPPAPPPAAEAPAERTPA